MGDVIGGVADFAGGAIDMVGDAIDSVASPRGDAISWMGDGISSVGGTVGDVAGGITDMFFSPLQTIPEMVGGMIGGFGPIQASSAAAAHEHSAVGHPSVSCRAASAARPAPAAGGRRPQQHRQHHGRQGGFDVQRTGAINNLVPGSETYERDLNAIQLAMSSSTPR